MFHYHRIWTDEAGDAHIEQVEVTWHQVADYAAGVPPVTVSDPTDALRSHFSVLPSDWYGDWHPAPSRQFVVLLQGTLEVTTADGVMTGGPGTVWLIEDTTGRGHCTRVLGPDDAIRISIELTDVQ